MTWKRGFSRLRFIGITSMALGMVMLAVVWTARAMGVEADPVSAFMCMVLWEAGITLMVLGNVLWVALWVLKGFIPENGLGAPIALAAD